MFIEMIQENKKATAFILILALLVGIFVIPSYGAGADKTALLMGNDETDTYIKKLTVTQGNTINPGGTIKFDEDVSVSLEFGVPVINDDGTDGRVDQNNPSTFIQFGDWVELPLSVGFKLVSESGPFKLRHNNVDIGTLRILSKEEPTGTQLYARIDFDGDPEVFDGIGGWMDVEVSFNAELKYNGKGQSDVVQHVGVQILKKAYTVEVLAIPASYSGVKTGVVDGAAVSGGSIIWTIEARNFGSSSQPITFGAITFYDNLAGVGELVDGSFKIGPSEAELISSGDYSYDSATGILTYNLANHSGLQFIQFKTKIPSTEFYKGTGGTVKNTAYLKEGETNKVIMSDTVSFNFGWIGKTGSVHEFTAGIDSGKIKWVITANNLGYSLENAVITDTLRNGLEFESATLSKYDGVDWGPEVIIPNTYSDPSDLKNLVFEMGNITTPVRITIISKVTDNIGHSYRYYVNDAKLSWKDYDGEGDGIGSNEATVGIGVRPIGKKAGTFDVSKNEMPWTVTVTKSDITDNLYVMDLFVYGDTLSSSQINSIHSIAVKENPLGVDPTAELFGDIDVALIKNKISYGQLTQNVKQKYSANSFLPITGINLSYIAYTIKDSGGNDLADLLVVAGNGGKGIDTSSDRTFTFSTKLTDPNIYAGNEFKYIYNTVSLFSGDYYVSNAKATGNYNGRMLVKDMMLRSEFGTDYIDAKATKPGAATGDSGFNYIDHTVVFRLHVNANDLKELTDNIGPVTLTDKLPRLPDFPADWEYVPIVSGGAMFYIYNGIPSDVKGKVKAIGDPILDWDSFMEASITEGGTSAEFKFNKLDKPYVIFVRAKLKDDVAADFFSGNKGVRLNYENTGYLKGTGYTGPDGKGVGSTQAYYINNAILSKAREIVGSGDNRAVRWTIEYKPNTVGEGMSAVTAIDTLPEGLDLRVDPNGKLLAETDGVANLSITRLILNINGSYSVGGAENVQEYIDSGGLSFDVATRELKWEILDPGQAYRFSYVTDVTGEPGSTPLKNEVKLISVWTTEESVSAQYTVQALDVSATMKRGGWFELTKIDGSAGPDVGLEGVIFQLLTEDGNSVLRIATTDNQGKIVFRGLPVNNPGGFYRLEEVNSVGLGLKPLVKVYDVQVTASGPGGAIETFIYEGGYPSGQKSDPNEITLYNYYNNLIGNLEVSKALFGHLAESDKEFDFTIKSNLARGPFEYVLSTIVGGLTTQETGFATFDGSGEFTFELKGGQTIEFKDLPFDNYIVTESNYFTDHYITYVNDLPVNTANVTLDAFTQDGQVTFENSRASWIEITKTDAEDTSELLAGAEFTLYEGDGTVVASGTTGADGKIRFNNIDVGEYYFKETNPPASYGQQYDLQGIGNIQHSVKVTYDPVAGFTTTINEDPGNEVSLVNYKNDSVGDLRITKILSGNNTSRTKEFEFTITITSMAGLSAPAVGGGVRKMRQFTSVLLELRQRVWQQFSSRVAKV